MGRTVQSAFPPRYPAHPSNPPPFPLFSRCFADCTVLFVWKGCLNLDPVSYTHLDVYKRQREDYGKIDVSLYKFNDKVNRVVNNQPASEVRTLTLKDYNPSSFTALYDAVGKAIHETDKQIALIPEAERPNKVMKMCIRDRAILPNIVH